MTWFGSNTATDAVPRLTHADRHRTRVRATPAPFGLSKRHTNGVDTLGTSQYRMDRRIASQVDTDVDASWTPAGASPLGDREETR